MESRSTHLTERVVARLKAPTEGYYIVYDADAEKGKGRGVTGFGVRVAARSTKNPVGVKAFVFTYRFKGHVRTITIGRLGAWTVLAARNHAKDLRRQVDTGADPMANRDAERGAPTMGELFRRYLVEYALRKKKLSSVREDWGLIHGGKFRFDGKTLGKPDDPFSGVLGKFFHKMPIEDVTHADVMRFHGALHERPYRANRALACLSKVMNLAEKWGLRALNSNPCRHIEKYKEEVRKRYLKHDELTALSKVLDDAKPMFNKAGEDVKPMVAAAIKLALYTGCRISEVLDLQWDNIDTRSGVATLEDAKAGARYVQLPTPALRVLAELGTSEGRVFGDLNYDAVEKRWRRIRKDAGFSDARIHDCRHTVGTYAGKSGTNAFIVKDLLGHKTLSMTDRYVGQYDDPVKAASEAVSKQIAAAFKGRKAEVISHPKSGRR
jgi:integrase